MTFIEGCVLNEMLQKTIVKKVFKNQPSPIRLTNPVGGVDKTGETHCYYHDNS